MLVSDFGKGKFFLYLNFLGNKYLLSCFCYNFFPVFLVLCFYWCCYFLLKFLIGTVLYSLNGLFRSILGKEILFKITIFTQENSSFEFKVFLRLFLFYVFLNFWVVLCFALILSAKFLDWNGTVFIKCTVHIGDSAMEYYIKISF